MFGQGRKDKGTECRYIRRNEREENKKVHKGYGCKEYQLSRVQKKVWNSMKQRLEFKRKIQNFLEKSKGQ